MCVCMFVFYFYLWVRQRVINIAKHISENSEPEYAGLLNKSSFVWLDVGA